LQAGCQEFEFTKLHPPYRHEKAQIRHGCLTTEAGTYRAMAPLSVRLLHRVRTQRRSILRLLLATKIS